MKVEFPDKFDAMADMEHKLTAMKGEPVTMLKDQGMAAKKLAEETGLKWKQFVFLKKHPDYPELKSIDDMKAHEVMPIVDCNGFCGVNDLSQRVSTENEINYINE